MNAESLRRNRSRRLPLRLRLSGATRGPRCCLAAGRGHAARVREHLRVSATGSDPGSTSAIERAAGNPLFLEQLLRHAETSSAAGVPASVQSLVQARMDQLGQQEKQVLQAASVFGQRFAPDALRHVIGDPDDACAVLVRRFLVRPAGRALLPPTHQD